MSMKPTSNEIFLCNFLLEKNITKFLYFTMSITFEFPLKLTSIILSAVLVQQIVLDRFKADPTKKFAVNPGVLLLLKTL